MEFVTKEFIPKGWSGDKKYCVTDESGARYLLRLSVPDKLERKRAEFARMQQLSALGIPMCQPVEFGLCEEGVYTLLSWIDGVDVEEGLKSLSEGEQYAQGLEAGRILQIIHSIPAPTEQEEWEPFFNRKIDRKLRGYQECPLKYETDQPIMDYIAENRQLLRGRPQTYQHGDYHTGNMMLTREGQLVIIDFDRDDYGDPWEEFNRIVWCAQVSPSFASGMVDGYFGGPVPMAFWRLLALYISSNTLSSLPWAIPFGEGEVEIMRAQQREILAWFDNMKNPVPTWYRTPRQPGLCEAPRAVAAP